LLTRVYPPLYPEERRDSEAGVFIKTNLCSCAMALARERPWGTTRTSSVWHVPSVKEERCRGIQERISLDKKSSPQEASKKDGTKKRVERK
jgi:hypothetical protein